VLNLADSSETFEIYWTRCSYDGCGKETHIKSNFPKSYCYYFMEMFKNEKSALVCTLQCVMN
jgi:hypothetical protein